MPRSPRSSSDADIWDDILADDDEATKVLSYQPQESTEFSSQQESSTEHLASISAERPMHAPRPAAPASVQAAHEEQPVASRREKKRGRKASEEREAPVQARSSAFQSQAPRVPSRFARMQLWPGFLGFLASATALQGLLWMYQLIIRGARLDHAISVPVAIERALTQDAASAPTHWINFGVLLALWACAFGLGGYTAARLARFVAPKQGLAVFLWFILASALSTMVSFLWKNLLPSEPFFSWMRLADASVSNNVLGLLAIILAALGGVLLGSLMGKSYGQKLSKENSVYH